MNGAGVMSIKINENIFVVKHISVGVGVFQGFIVGPWTLINCSIV